MTAGGKDTQAGEREFLHDLSTSISVAMTMLDLALEALEDGDPPEAHLAAHLAAVKQALAGAGEKISRRRGELTSG